MNTETEARPWMESIEIYVATVDRKYPNYIEEAVEIRTAAKNARTQKEADSVDNQMNFLWYVIQKEISKITG